MKWLPVVVVGTLAVCGVVGCKAKSDGEVHADQQAQVEDKGARKGARFTYEVNYEDDSVRVASKYFGGSDSFIPGATEVWRVNKSTGDSVLCVKSDPRYFGNFSDTVSPNIVRSISVVRCWPRDVRIIVEGPTCHAGDMASYVVDTKSGAITRLPINCGFIGRTPWGDYIVGSSRVSGLDYDLALRYEDIHVMDWDGNIISTSSTKNGVIEEALPFIHHEARWNVEKVKLDKHIPLTPVVPDSDYYGNEYQVRYEGLREAEIAQLDSLVAHNGLWQKKGPKYYYHYDSHSDPEAHAGSNGIFVTIEVNPAARKGVVKKGGYSDQRNLPR